MKRIVLANAFSLGMLDTSRDYVISVKPLTNEEQLSALRTMLKHKGFESAIGHESTAQFLTKKLGIEIPANRVPVKLTKGDLLVVFQLLQRLPEGKVLTEEEIAQIPMNVFLVEIVDEKEAVK